MRNVLFLALLTTTTACGNYELADDFTTTLTQFQSCSNFVVASDSDDSVMMVLSQTTDAWGPSKNFSFNFADASPGAALYVETGKFVAGDFCSDIPNDKLQVKERYHATAGVATLTTGVETTLTGGASGYLATWTLSDVVFADEPDGAHEVIVAAWSQADIEIPK